MNTGILSAYSMSDTSVLGIGRKDAYKWDENSHYLTHSGGGSNLLKSKIFSILIKINI